MHFLSFILQLVVGVFSTFMDRHLKDYLWLRCLYMHRYKNRNRTAGETKWNFQKLLRYAVDGVINFSQVPLSAASWFENLMTVVVFVRWYLLCYAG